MKNLIKNHFTEFGLLVAAVVSVALTTVVSIWEWLENPGGIFRNEQGTNWQFVFDTAWSWFGPTFLYVVVLMSLGHLLWVCGKWLVARLSSK
jgi:hypothetical protein